MKRIIDIINSDPVRVNALRAVSKLALPNGYLAAGFVRNGVWDWLHEYPVPTQLTDLDVIYFDLDASDEAADRHYEKLLHQALPEHNWQVKNQVFMHSKNGDAPYTSVEDAMSHWPEKETALAIRMLDSGELECITAFDTTSLFAGDITYNPNCDINTFQHRVRDKQWLVRWPKLKLKM